MTEKKSFFDRVKTGFSRSEEELQQIKLQKEQEKQRKLEEEERIRLAEEAEYQRQQEEKAEIRRQQEEEKQRQLAEKEAAQQAKEALKSQQKAEGSDWVSRVKEGLKRTNEILNTDVVELVKGKEIDDELLEELETLLLMADVGIAATEEIIEHLTERVSRNELADGDALYQALQDELYNLLLPCEQPLQIPDASTPYVIMVVGVNGVGKTTTIGKMSKRFQAQGKGVMLAAGDTFRAAAVEQLQVWGERNDVPVVAQHTGADSASVIFDAIASAQSKGVDVLIADTAGRLHNKDNLMEELAKVKRVMAKLDDSAPHEVLLVLDAGTGQNALNQVETFVKSSGVTGLALTKLDGTAKGGVIFALAKQFGLPVRFIGVGEGVDDLQPFDARTFVDALFAAKDG